MENDKGPNEDLSKTEEGKWWKGVHPVRKIIREILAIAFWTHAVYILHFIDLHSSNISSLPRYLYNFALILFILYYSFFSKRGWVSVIFDLGYIYFWPFIMMIRLFWISSRKGYKYFRSQLTIPKANLLVPPTAQIAVSQTPQETKPMQESAKVSKSTEQPESMLKRLFRPAAQLLFSGRF